MMGASVITSSGMLLVAAQPPARAAGHGPGRSAGGTRRSHPAGRAGSCRGGPAGAPEAAPVVTAPIDPAVAGLITALGDADYRAREKAGQGSGREGATRSSRTSCLAID